MVKATKDNRPFSSGVFDLEEFNIYTKVIDLPLDGIPTYLEEGINGVCTGGSALFNVFSNKRRVVKNDLITIFPYQLASITEISTDFAVIFFKVPKKLFMDTINGLGRLTLDYFFYMRKYYSSPLSEEEYKRFVHFCHILSCRVDLSCAFLRRESVMYLLRVYYWDLYVGYKSNPKAMASVKFVRKEKQVFEFFYLVIEYHTISRDVAFYADKMCISPKYLTMLITDNTGRSAKEWIVEYTILEIKVLLKDSNLEIKEVSLPDKNELQALQNQVGMDSLQAKQILEGILKLEKMDSCKPLENRQLELKRIWLNKLVSVLEEHMENTEFNVAMLCQLLGMNRKLLYRKIKQLTGVTPVSLIRRVRMIRAATLLLQGRFTVSEVMYMVGYSNPSYFSRCFMAEYNISPSQYAIIQKKTGGASE